jgi:hypothetical protein
VQYQDTVTDPVGTGVRVLAALGVAATPADIAAMQACVAGNVRENRPVHRYAAADFGIDAAQVAQDFAFYTAPYLHGEAKP